MSSPGLSSGTNKPAELFEDLWRQLREYHQSALQELEAKVSKLKKERCLDAQRLEVFYSRNQQLKEQNKSLQDAVSLLEERLRAGECDRCAAVEEKLKNQQEQSLRLIAKLKNERNDLEDDNRKIHAELQELKASRSEPQRDSTSEQEDGIIPDSPVLPNSLPVANRLRKHKHSEKSRRVRYSELPLPRCNNSLFKELNKEPVPGRAEVLVPNTCDLDSSQIPNDMNHNRDEVIAETCALELHDQHHAKTEMTAGQQSGSHTSWKNNVCLKPHCFSSPSKLIHSPDSTTERSPSRLPRVKRFSQDGSNHKAKRKKEESQQENKQHGIQEGVGTLVEAKCIQPELFKCTSTPTNNQSFMKQQLDSKAAQNGIPASPPFKKPEEQGEGEGDGVGRRRNPLLDVNASHDQREAEDAERRHRVEPVWSIDPALALSMYETDWRGDEQTEAQHHAELMDTDCTWVSHSLLQKNGRDSMCGLGEKANDSLDMMFDATTCGEYKSYNSPHLGQSRPCDGDDYDDGDDDDDDEEEEDEEEDKDSEQEAPENTPVRSKAQRPTFAHVAVIRKKDERRKLKGTTCKECEIYYAHLPEEEKQKKLSACSRHRFLYIPPSTPENFWEVGFPSTQTCIERGYIKEEKNPQARLRRRQPLNALFSPMLERHQQES